MSLRLRLTLTYSLLVSLILSLFGAILYSTLRHSLEQEMDKRLRVRASQVELTIFPDTLSLTAGDLTSATLDLSPLADLDAPGVYVQVLDRQGNVVATSSTLHGIALPITAAGVATSLSGTHALTTVSISSDRAVRVLSLPVTIQGKIVGILQVGQSRQPLRQTLADLRTLLLILGTAALAVCGLVGWTVAQHGLRPVRQMSERAAALAEQGDFSRRLGVGGGRDEVGQLSRTIDQLLATVDAVLRSHREFVADTSHELRNPLLAIHTNLDLLDRLSDPADRAECLHEAREQVDRMSRLVADLLVLARAESGQLVEQRPVALASLVERVARLAERQAAGQRIALGQLASLEVIGDAGRLEQMLSNLIANALQHTPRGGTITLSLLRCDGWARVNVADTGEGIAAEELPHIFERFYQVRRDGRRTRGTGLGLAIVDHLARAHGGRVTVASTPDAGSCFSVWLPLVPHAVAADPSPPAASIA